MKISEMMQVDSLATPGDDQSCPMSSGISKSGKVISTKDRATLETPLIKAK